MKIDLTDCADNTNDSNDSCEDFAFEYTPKRAKPENQDGINIKGDSDEFKDASEKVLKMMEQKGKQYTISGRELRIKSVTKNGIATTIIVEVSTQ